MQMVGRLLHCLLVRASFMSQTVRVATAIVDYRHSTAFASMTQFSTTGNTSHSTTLTGLTNGGSYTYYVKCKDAAGNISPDSNTSFSVSNQAPAGGGGGGTYDSATSVWANAVVADGGTVSATEEGYVDTLIKGLKADGIWSNLDRLWLLASENTHEAKIDIVNLQSNTNHGATFTANRGYAGDGASTYVDSNYVPATAGGNLTLNSASFGIYDQTNNQSANGAFGGEDTSAANRLILLTRANVFLTYYVNSGAGDGTQNNVSTYKGMWVMTRTGASATAIYQNGSLNNSGTAASAALTSSSLYIVGAADYNSGSLDIANADQISAAFVGGSLTATQASQISGLINAYMTSVGSNVY
jgi:hypothetical protein